MAKWENYKSPKLSSYFFAYLPWSIVVMLRDVHTLPVQNSYILLLMNIPKH